MSEVLISVIIPTFNRAMLLRETLLSIANQTFAQWECLIVDDGSVDETANVALEFTKNDPRYRFLTRPDSMSKGANTCRNLGLEAASGNYIKWLDSDDLLKGDCLEKQLKQLTSVAHCDVSFCQGIFFRSSIHGKPELIQDRVWSKLRPRDNASLIDAYILEGVRWATPCGLWKRSFLPQKPFLEGLNNSQEWLMHLTMLVLRPNCAFVNESLVYIRSHEGSMSHATNKKGSYYYHQCIARIHALNELREHSELNVRIYRKIIRFIFWNHLFVFYKGAPVLGFSFFRHYPALLKDLFVASKHKDSSTNARD
jgi:glycosyltransferase involved in cell wall biosynthesis